MMPEKIRALIVILALATPAFYIARQIAGSIIADREFVFWRNVWFTVTVLEFLSGSILIHMAVLSAVSVYAIRTRVASVGLAIVLLLAAPIGNLDLGGGGVVNRLIALNNARVLAVVLLVPLLFQRNFGRRNASVYKISDRLIVAYVLLLAALQFRNSEFTNVIRSAVQLTLDILIPYFAFSRTVTTTEDLRKVFLAFVIAVLPLSLICMIEVVKGWHLYAALAQDWGAGSGYLRREGMVRASASAFVSIAMGLVIMVGVGCLLGLWRSVRSQQFKIIIMLAFAGGLIGTLSRGPWVGTAVLLFIYALTGPNAAAKIGKGATLGAIAIAVLLILPGGTRLLDFLPFIGTVDSENVTYRQQLFENATAVIRQYPIFGTADYRATPEMQAMEQGQHIIDIVNTYLEIGLRSGLVGLTMFVGFFASIILGLRRVLKFGSTSEAGINEYVRAAMATLIAILVTIATVSSIDFIPSVYWSFAGLSVALIRVGYRERVAAARVPYASRAVNV